MRYQINRETKGDAPSIVVLETYVGISFFLLPESIISIANSLRNYGLVLTHHRYKDAASMQAHGASDHYKELGSAIKQEDLLAEPIKVLFTKDVGGYTSKL